MSHSTVATKALWKVREMPAHHKTLLLDGSFTPDEFAQLGQGFIPQEMEDKWFIYFDGEWLHFHRSWTGACIFQLQILADNNLYRANQALVNRHPDQYRATNDQHDVQLISFLIDTLLLKQFGNLPTPPGLSANDRERHQEHVMGKRQQDSSRFIRLRILPPSTV